MAKPGQGHENAQNEDPVFGQHHTLLTNTEA